MKYFYLLPLVAFVSFSNQAKAQLEPLCSVAADEFWAAGYGGEDTCDYAIGNVRYQMVGDNYLMRFPAFDVYVQSYYDPNGENTVIVSCKQGEAGYFSMPFSGFGNGPIVLAIDYGSRMPGAHTCRIYTENTALPSHPISDRSMEAFCFYQTLEGRSAFAIAEPGYGRDHACDDANQQVRQEDAFYISAGYFLAAGETRIDFDCPALRYNRAWVYGRQDMERFARFLNERSVTQCAITTDVADDVGYGAVEQIVIPGFERRGGGEDSFQIPTATEVTEAIAIEADEIRLELDQIPNIDLNSLIDQPEISIDPETGEASISMPSSVRDQIDLAEQARRPVPVTRRGPGHTNTASSNSWGFGNGYFGARFGYDVNSDNFSTINARTYAQTTVLGNFNEIFSGHGSMEFYGGGEVATAKAYTAVNVMGDTRVILDSTFQQPTGRTLPGRALLAAEFFRHSYQFLIGTVPVIGKVKVTGEIGYSSFHFGWERDATLTRHRVHSTVVPYGYIKGIGSGGIGIEMANAGAMGEVDLISGQLYGTASANARSANGDWDYSGCVSAGIRDLSWLKGQMYAYYTVHEPVTSYVEETIEQGCRVVQSRLGGIFGQWIERQVCDRLLTRFREVTEWTRFLRKKSVYKWNGRQIAGNHSWYNTCGM